MKIQVERDVLAEAVAWTARALPARPAVPVLAGIRLQAAADLTLSSFDYDVSAQARVPVEAEEEGEALVSGRLLAEITRSLPARPVEITTDGSRATLTCGSATFTLLTMPTEDYPSLPEMPPPAGSIGSDAFASAVSQSATAAGRDDTLPALTGVRIEIEGETLTLVSTDRYRLAVRELRWTPARPDLSAAVLVPGPGAGRHRPRADRRRGSVDRAGAAWRGGRRRRGDDRVRGRRPPDHHPAARRRLPALRVPAAQAGERGGRTGGRAVRRGGQAGRPGRRAQHRGPAVVLPGAARARGRDRRRGAGRGGHRRELRGRRHRRSRSTRSTCWTG